MANPNPKLTINVTLTEFKVLAVDDPRFCTADTYVIYGGPGNNHPTVANRVQVKGRKKKIDLAFKIINGTANASDTFRPAGIAIIGGIGNTDPAGNTFSGATCVGDTITVTDNTSLSGIGASAPVWEAYITVVRLSDLAIGVIDPGVENSDDAIIKGRGRTARRRES